MRFEGAALKEYAEVDAARSLEVFRFDVKAFVSHHALVQRYLQRRHFRQGIGEGLCACEGLDTAKL